MTNFGLGFGYMMSGDREKALLWFRKAIEINPQNHNAINFIKKVETQ